MELGSIITFVGGIIAGWCLLGAIMVGKWSRMRSYFQQTAEALSKAASTCEHIADGRISPQDGKGIARRLGKTADWAFGILAGDKEKKKKSKTSLFMVPVITLVLVSALGCVSSQTGTVQTGVGQWGEGTADAERTPYISVSVPIIFRHNPNPGAVESFVGYFGKFLNDINVPAAVVSGLTSPERMVSDLGDGTQARITPNIRVPVINGHKSIASIDFSDIREAAQKALKKAGLDGRIDGTFMGRGKITGKCIPIEPAVANASENEDE